MEFKYKKGRVYTEEHTESGRMDIEIVDYATMIYNEDEDELHIKPISDVDMNQVTVTEDIWYLVNFVN